MRRVFVDADLVRDDRGALDHLEADGGFEVVVAPDAAAVADAAVRVPAVADAAGGPGAASKPKPEPDRTGPVERPPTPAAWLLSGTTPPWSGHRPELWTILVGPAPEGDHGPDRRSDFEARDLRAAVVEVLVREAMPDLSVERPGRRTLRR